MTARGPDGRFFRVEFQAGGIRDVQQAFRSVLQATLDSAKAAQRASQETIRAHEHTAREIRRIENQKEHAYQQMLKGMAREDAKAHADSIRELEQAERKKQQIQEAYAKSNKQMREDLQRREHEEADRRNEMWARRGLAGEVRAGIYRGINAGMQVAGQAAQVATGVFGGFSIADTVHTLNKFQSSVTALSNATYIPDQKDAKGNITNPGTARAKAADIEAVAREGEAASGYTKQELVDAWSGYVEKSSDSAAFVGDDMAKRKESKIFLIEMAQLAKGSGANIADVMNAAGVLQVQNENMSAADRATTMRNIVGQGKLGAISMPDLAKAVPKITASSSQFAMGTTEAQRALLGISQIAVQTAGTAPVAATAVANMVGETGKKHDKIKKDFGVETKDEKTGKLLDPSIFMAQLMEKVGGDTSKLQKIYGQQGIRVFTALSGTFNEARDLAKATGADEKASNAAGAAAVRKKIAKFEAQGYSKGDAKEDFEAVMMTREEKFKKARVQTQNAIEDALLPALEKFAAVLPEITPALVKFIEFISKNPMEGAGLLIGASIAKQMSAALIQDILTKALGGAGGPISLAIVAGFMAWKQMEAQMAEDQKRVADRGQLSEAAYEAGRDLKKAKTPEEREAAKKKALAVQEALVREAALTEGGDHSTTNDAGRAVAKYGIAPLKAIAESVIMPGVAAASAATGHGGDVTGAVGALSEKTGLNAIEERVKAMDAVAKKHHETFLADLDMLGKRMRKVAEEDAKSGHGHVPMSAKTHL